MKKTIKPKVKTLTTFAPASIGNLSVGFDLLGLAIKPCDGTFLGDLVTLTECQGEDSRLIVTGEYADSLPDDPKDNIVMRCCELFASRFNAHRKPLKHLQIQLAKNLPVGSGLGSSASSVVATLAALGAWFGQTTSQVAMLEMMSLAEGFVSGSAHFDNIAPSYLGGLILCDTEDRPQQLPWPEVWRVIVAYPNRPVRTSEARKVLPEAYRREQLLKQNAALAYFVHALHVGDLDLAAKNIVDVVAEPYRKALLPKFSNTRQYLLDHGALAVGISGSGPTIFAIVDNQSCGEQLTEWLGKNYAKNGFSSLCTIDSQGVRIMSEE